MPRSGWVAIGATLSALVLPGTGRLAAALGLAVAGLLLLALPRLTRGRRMAVLAAMLGAAAVALRLAVGGPPSGLAGDVGPEGQGPWTMLVETVGAPREGRQVATLRSAGHGLAELRLAATLPRYPPVEPGDTVVVEGRARVRPDTPYGDYLERIGAWGTLQARRLEIMSVPDTSAGRTLERLRRGAGDVLATVLPEPEAGLAAGILIGLRDRVDRDVATAFTTAGVSHVVAISGWNIAIVAAAVAALAGRIGRRRRAIVTAVAIAAYIVFAGASPSVLRAGAMAGVVLLARESGRAGLASAALGWAAALLLVAEPGLVSDAGFQLSTLATAGLIVWASPLTERIDRWSRGRLPRWLSESLGVSLAAQAATLPVVLGSFGRLALIAPAVNLLVVPLVAPVMVAGVIAFTGGLLVGVGAPGPLGAILAAPGWVGLRLMVGIVEAAAAIPFASVSVPPAIAVPLAVTLVGVAAIVRLVSRRLRDRRSRHGGGVGAGAVAATAVATERRNGRASAGTRRAGRGTTTALRVSAGLLVVAIGLTGAVVATRPTGVARIAVLDVGQGDAILVEGARSGRLLVDGGPDPNRLLVELDRRIPPWDRRIDAVVLTHPHEDHVAGLVLLLDRYRVGTVFEPGMRGPGPGYAAWQGRRGRARRPPATRAGRGRSAPRGRHRDPRPVAGPRRCPDRAAERRLPDQPGLDRAARHGRRSSLPADRRRRGGRRSAVAVPRAATDRCPQDLPSREPHGDDRAVRQGDATGDRHRIDRCREYVRASGAGHPRSAVGGRCPRLSDRPRRHRDRHLRRRGDRCPTTATTRRRRRGRTGRQRARFAPLPSTR